MERKLDWLEAMRGLAALWVLLHHAKQSVDHFVADMGQQPWFSHGFLGVDFFFVLSGFIIAFASHRLEVRGGGLREYASARLVRIYSPYLPVGMGMYLVYLLLPSLSEGGRTPSLLTSLFLLPTNQPPALSVAWTLVHEVVFYALYAVSFLHKRLFTLIFGGWVAAIISIEAMGVELPLMARYLLSPLNLCFVLGVLIFHLNQRLKLAAWIALLVGTAGVGMVGREAMGPTPDRVVVAIGFGLAVWAAASPASSQWKVWRPLVTLGAASYAIYLVHNPALSLLVRLAPDGMSAGLAYVLVASTALACGVLYWWWCERPVLAWVRQRIASRGDHAVLVGRV